MRSKIPRCHLILFIMMALAATPLLAQERCLLSDTVAECIGRYLGWAAYVQSAMAREERELEDQPTGVDTGGASIATNSKDFSPVMALAGLLGQSSADDTTGMVVYDLNFLIPGLAEKGSKNSQLQALVNPQPQISDLLRNALPEEERDDLAGKLEDRLGDLADYTIRFTYNHSKGPHSRNFAQYKKAYWALADAAIVDKGSPMSLQDLSALAGPNVKSETTLENLSPDERLSLEKSAYSLAMSKDQTDFETEANLDMTVAGLRQFNQLVDNQPQLHLTAERKFRDPLVGADELGVNVTYEWSPRSLSRALKRKKDMETDSQAHCLDTLEKPPEGGNARQRQDAEKDYAKTARTCLNYYMEYVRVKKEAIEKGHRFSFSGEYVDIDGETVDPELQTIAPALPRITPVVFESARTLKLSAGWSRNIFVNLLGGDEPVKVDLVATYEDVSDDPMRQDRGIASLTFTGRMGDMEIPFGIVYANHGEFLPDVDARLSAHLGLQFKMSGSNDDQ